MLCMSERHIVLDIDECLVKTFSNNWNVYDTIMNSSELFYLRNRIFTIRSKGINMWGIKRPYLNQFIQYIYDKFNSVSVWSAGEKNYVEAVVEEIFRDHKYPSTVMNWDNIVLDDTGYWKALDRFYNKSNKADPSNTFLLDNKLDNFKDDINNGLHIPDYDPLPTVEDISRDDTCLVVVMAFVDSISQSNTDIRIIDKNLSY